MFPIANIPADKITQAYTGRRGCMCGCCGKYHETPGMIKRILKNAQDLDVDCIYDIQSSQFGNEKTLCIEWKTWGGTERRYVFYFEDNNAQEVGTK